MIAIFLQTLPFSSVIALGYLAARMGMFSEEANGHLTKFVFYFALPAMIIKFSANLSFGDLLDGPFIAAYLWASLLVYLLATGVALVRGRGVAEAAVEAQCAVIGNVGFLGLPMLALLFGPEAVIWVMLVLCMDLLIFGSLIVILVTGSRDGRLSFGVFKTVGQGLVKNPMIVALAFGLLWASTGYSLPTPVFDFVDILGAAATPGALFVIGASLASKAVERMSVAGWLAFCKLILHPAAVAFAVLILIPVQPYPAAVMIATAALPVAGNVYILAKHYEVAPMRVSASILISTVISVVTVSLVVAWVTTFY